MNELETTIEDVERHLAWQRSLNDTVDALQTASRLEHCYQALAGGLALGTFLGGTIGWWKLSIPDTALCGVVAGWVLMRTRVRWLMQDIHELLEWRR